MLTRWFHTSLAGSKIKLKTVSTGSDRSVIVVKRNIMNRLDEVNFERRRNNTLAARESVEEVVFELGNAIGSLN